VGEAMRGFDLKAYLLLKQLIEEGSGNIDINQIQSDWNQEDETQADFIKNKPDITTDDEFIMMLMEEDMFPVVADADGSVLADENGNILLWYRRKNIMANVKNITELPLAESAEGLNLIVNDGGSAKQIAASAVGAQADWSETNENSSAFIKNKPEIAEKPFNIDRELVITFTKDDLDEYKSLSSPRIDCLNENFDEFYYEYKYSISGTEYIHTKYYDGNAGDNPGFAIYWQGKYWCFINNSDTLYISQQYEASNEMKWHEFISLSIYREKSKLIPDDCVNLSNTFQVINNEIAPMRNVINNELVECLYIDSNSYLNYNLSSLDVGGSYNMTWRYSFKIRTNKQNGNFYENVYPEAIDLGTSGKNSIKLLVNLTDTGGTWKTHFIDFHNGYSVREYQKNDNGECITTNYQYQLYGTIIIENKIFSVSMICNDETSATLTITRVI
jgi:hypothetical protein